MDTTKWKTRFPVAAIISVDNKTKIRVWKDRTIGYTKKLAEEDETAAEIITIKAGQAFIFHALLVHSGVHYDQANIRAHCYGIQDIGQLPGGDVTLVN